MALFSKNKNNVLTNSSSNAKSSTTDIGNNKSLLVLIILVILLVIAFAFNMTKTKTPINEQDIEHLKQTINDAQEIAKIQYTAPSISQNNNNGL